MEYSSSVWGLKCYSKIDTVHNRIMKYFLGVPKSTSTLVIYGDTGLLPPVIHRKIAMLRFWKRMLFMNDHRLTKHIFLFDFAKCKYFVRWGNMKTLILRHYLIQEAPFYMNQKIC